MTVNGTSIDIDYNETEEIFQEKLTNLTDTTSSRIEVHRFDYVAYGARW